jgi:two-component system, OmpR family, heavy metal sensor histidine kinase CusS
MLERFSIRFRLTAWYSLSLALVLGLVAVASYFAMRASMYRAVDVDLRYRVAGVEEFLESQESSSLSELPEEIAGKSTVDVLFQVFDDQGKLIYQSEVLASHHINPVAPSVPGATIVYRDFGDEHWPVRLAAQRITFQGQPIIVEVAQPLRFHYASLQEFAMSLLVALPLLVAIAAFVGYWLSGRALAPVNQIVEDARTIDSNRLSQRVSVPAANDELRRLSQTLNSMLDRIEVSVTRIKQFTADASHELRAPVTLIQAAAEYTLRRERSRDELVEAMEKILRESKRTSQLIDNLLLLARADSDDEVIKSGPVRVDSAVREAVDRASQLATSKHIQIATKIDEDAVYVNGEVTLLQRLFFVLIENGVKYTPENGTVSVALRSGSDEVVIEVADTGIGIAPEDLSHVFERFWRADKVRSREMGGTGLGLSIAKWIVEKSGGSIQVESAVGHGSKFEVRLPKLQNIESEVVSKA